MIVIKIRKLSRCNYFLEKIYLKNIRDLTKEINEYRYTPRPSTQKIREFSKIDLDIEVSESKFYFQPHRHKVKFIGSIIKHGT